MDKKTVFEHLYARGSVFVSFDSRKFGVVIPAYLRGQPQIILKFGDDLIPPMTDLDVTEGAVSATLSFGVVPFYCVVPWSAVFSVANSAGIGHLWEDEVPKELLRRMDQPKLRVIDGERTTKPKPRPVFGRHLRLA